jgi:hypothetical protein
MIYTFEAPLDLAEGDVVRLVVENTGAKLILAEPELRKAR